MLSNHEIRSLPLRRSLWRRIAVLAEQEAGAPRRVPGGTAGRCRLAARLAAGHYRVPLNQVMSRRRGSRETVRARHVAMYLAHVVYRLNLAEVAAGFRRDRTTAAYACAKIEDARDDPAFDAALSGLEISAGILLAAGPVEEAA
jgi:hypothetical protein